MGVVIVVVGVSVDGPVFVIVRMSGVSAKAMVLADAMLVVTDMSVAVVIVFAAITENGIVRMSLSSGRAIADSQALAGTYDARRKAAIAVVVYLFGIWLLKLQSTTTE